LQILESPKNSGWLRDGKIANWQIHQSTQFGRDDFINKTLVCNPANLAAFQHLARHLSSHIARLPKTSTKACFAQQAITKKKCKAKIVQGNKVTVVPHTLALCSTFIRKRRKLCSSSSLTMT
jgi:hypothetical protein